MEEMLYIVHHPKESPLHILGHGFLFLDYLTRSMAPFRVGKNGKIQDFYMREALAFIEQNFQNDISVEDIAAQCGLNRSYFGTIFRQALGQTPQEFLIHYRMIKAAELLKMTQFSIQDIANAVGYSNPLHFPGHLRRYTDFHPVPGATKTRLPEINAKNRLKKDVGAPPTSFIFPIFHYFLYFILLPSCLFDDKPFPTHHIHDFFHVFHT